MRERSSKTGLYTVDAVLVTAMGNQLAILLVRNSSERERWSLPWRTPQTGESLDAAAASTADEALGESPTWMEQIGAFGDGKRHPSEADVSVAYLGLVPHETASPERAIPGSRSGICPPCLPGSAQWSKALLKPSKAALTRRRSLSGFYPPHSLSASYNKCMNCCWVNACTKRVSGVPFRPLGSSNLWTNGVVKAGVGQRSFSNIYRRKSVGHTAA